MKVFTDMIKVLDGQNRDNSDKSIIESVGKEGVLVPLLVYSDPEETGKYVLVAGHRRLASAVHFNLKEVPVEVIPQDPHISHVRHKAALWCPSDPWIDSMCS